MEFQGIQQRALAIRARYAAYERATYGRAWSREEIALGFVGDVGDLAKLALAREGRRAIPDAEAKLAHELADCLWSVIVLAEAHGVDLERAFLATMDELERRLGELERARAAPL
jgi:NTP pyrophosphatase (non-canonical NTP hydrolase)